MTTLAFKPPLHKPAWNVVNPSPSTGVAASCLAYDMRNTEMRDPSIFELVSNSMLNEYNTKTDAWSPAGKINPGLAGTFGAGAGAVFMPHRGPRGTISAVSAPGGNVQCTLSTLELAATAVANAFADRGDGMGYRIRIIDTTNGVTLEGTLLSNTASTTPVVVISGLGATPATGSSYEILSGRLYLLGSGTLTAASWQYYDIVLNVMSGNLTITNLPATLATESNLLCLDEQYVPANQKPGNGILGNLVATASASGTITGQASGGDAGVLANEFRNFQIRIITDSGTPASVGQRRRITSHTAGTSAVYTTNTAWTTTPSSTATFVIEYCNDIILTTGGQTSTYAYHADASPMNVTANTWDITTWAARANAIGAGACSVLAFGVSNAIVSGVTSSALYGTNDPNKAFRYSYVFSFRGGVSTVLDLFDIAGAATGAWTAAAPYVGSLEAFGTGSCAAYDAVSLDGKYLYINYVGGQYYRRFNVFSRTLDGWVYMRVPKAAAVVGGKMAVIPYIEPGGAGPNVSVVYSRIQSTATTAPSTELYKCIVMG